MLEKTCTIRPVVPPADVLIVEAAMMVEAGSDRTVDEVWVVFVPEPEAKVRLMARNGVTEEEAGKRIASQMTSSARLAHADVAIYNGASEDATQRQLERAWSEVATQRAGPCLEQWQGNFTRLQEQWRLSAQITTHSKAAPLQPHFVEAARSVWTRWAALMWRLDVDADVAERWFQKLVLVEKGVRREEEGEKVAEGEDGQQVGVAGGWVVAVILSFQHLRSQIHRVERPDSLKLALFFALHSASLGLPSPSLPPSTIPPPTSDHPPDHSPPAFPSLAPDSELLGAGVLAAARESLQCFAMDAGLPQVCLDQAIDMLKSREDGAANGSTTDRSLFWDRASPGSSASPGGDAASVELQRASAGGATSADCAASPGGDASGGGEPHLFCFGLGYVAVALANVLLTKGWRVSGTCRSQEDWHRLCHMGVQAHLLEDQGAESTLCLSQASLSALHSATHVLVSIPPLLSPRPSSPQHVDVVLSSCCQHLMQSARHRLRWIGYLSSTGVYGDWDGQWVDEDSPPRPLTPKAIARYAAEREWLAFQAQLGEALSDALVQTEALSDGIQRSEEGRSHLERSQGEGSALAVRVFRLGGIYGPFRSALDTAAAEMQAGEGPSLKSAPALNPPRNGRAESIYEGSSVSALKLTSDGDSDSSGSSSSNPDSSSNGLKSSSNRDRRQRKRFTSRCHVADICAAIGASMDGRGSSPIINVVDDDPSPRRHVMQFARQLIASGESDLYWQKLEALRVTLPPGIIRRGSSGRVRGAEQEKKRTTHPTVATGTDLMVTA
ncbi:unnamed protein product [Closterium sp. Naga37s-1]|nr:unnamed protein product [Closterium sp. Naga37s-1]